MRARARERETDIKKRKGDAKSAYDNIIISLIGTQSYWSRSIIESHLTLHAQPICARRQAREVLPRDGRFNKGKTYRQRRVQALAIRDDHLQKFIEPTNGTCKSQRTEPRRECVARKTTGASGQRRTGVLSSSTCALLDNIPDQRDKNMSFVPAGRSNPLARGPE